MYQIGQIHVFTATVSVSTISSAKLRKASSTSGNNERQHMTLAGTSLHVPTRLNDDR